LSPILGIEKTKKQREKTSPRGVGAQRKEGGEKKRRKNSGSLGRSREDAVSKSTIVPIDTTKGEGVVSDKKCARLKGRFIQRGNHREQTYL